MTARSGKELSRNDADTIALKNQQHSPLLRLLPGEVRNKIYNDVLGGLVVESEPIVKPEHDDFYSVQAIHDSNEYHLRMDCYYIPTLHSRFPVRARLSGSVEEAVTLPARLRLLMVCRQIHQETRLLPFQLNTFHTRPSDLKYFLNRLTNAQRDAITTFMLKSAIRYTVDTSSPEGLSRFWKRPMSINSGDVDWSAFVALVRMRGFKRVVVEDWCLEKDERQEELDKEKVTAGIIQCAGGRGIEITFDLSPLGSNVDHREAKQARYDDWDYEPVW